jgi:hypothetical protein
MGMVTLLLTAPFLMLVDAAYHGLAAGFSTYRALVVGPDK